MVSETLSGIKSDIRAIMNKHEISVKSIRVSHYQEASYFAFEGSWVYVIIDCPFSGDPQFCYIGETSNLGPTLRLHAKNHLYTHAFVLDLVDAEKEMRELVKAILVEKFKPEFQNTYYPFEAYRTNNFKREFETCEISKFNEMRRLKA